LSPVARPKELSSVWLLVVLFPAVLTVLLNAARPSLLTTKMRPSRGMGAIAPSKVPKLIKKRDGDEPVKVFKQGGKVKSFNGGGEPNENDMPRDIAKRQESQNPSGLRFSGEGGKDKYVKNIGGRLIYDIPVGKNATLSPYVDGFVAKPKDGKTTGRFTGAGVEFKKEFKQGGETKSKVNAAGNYTKPGLRKRIFNSVKAAAIVGTGAGQWSARKAQLMAKRYKASGGGYKD